MALWPIRIDTSPPLPAALRSLALRFQLTSYAAAYLELAQRLQLPIATRDDDLTEAAWAAGVAPSWVERNVAPPGEYGLRRWGLPIHSR